MLTFGRLYLRKGKTEEDLTEALASLPAGLAHSRNLHAADVYPVRWLRIAYLPTFELYLIQLPVIYITNRPVSLHVSSTTALSHSVPACPGSPDNRSLCI